VRTADILRFALGALLQQKVRTLLTTLGVVLGTFVLVASVSVGRGVRDKILSVFQRSDMLRRIEVGADYSVDEEKVSEEVKRIPESVSEAKRERLRQALLRERNMRGGTGPKVALTREKLDAIAKLDNVVSVLPQIQLPGRIHLGEHVENIMVFGLPPQSSRLRDRLIAGDGFHDANEHSLVVSELLLYRWGIIEDADVESQVGKKVRLDCRFYGMPSHSLILNLLGAGGGNPNPRQEIVLEKIAKQVPAALEKLDLSSSERAMLKDLLTAPKSKRAFRPDVVVAEEFTIAGVVRLPVDDDIQPGWFNWEQQSLHSDVLLPIETAEAIAFRLPDINERGLNGVTVLMHSEENVDEAAAAIKDMGLRPFALTEIANQVRLNLLLISLAMAFVAGVALIVAALGITNTMLMTVLERTHEIGVMKAVGARDIHIQLIFLVEGSLIGVIGGLLGLLAAWLVSFPGNAIARSIVEKQTRRPLEESLFAFPFTEMAGIVLFAATITTLAAVYPARRAARVNPVTALRHE
jgi:putative ABC transport system permease protein